MSLKVKLLNENAKAPFRANPGDAGYDLTACEDCYIFPVEYDGVQTCIKQALVSTGISVKIPDGHYGRIAPRSGFSWKKYTDIGAGVIDSGYRGELKVLVRNLGNNALEIKKGDKIAQLIIEKISTPVVEIVDELDETERGDGGFGSTDFLGRSPTVRKTDEPLAKMTDRADQLNVKSLLKDCSELDSEAQHLKDTLKDDSVDGLSLNSRDRYDGTHFRSSTGSVI